MGEMKFFERSTWSSGTFERARGVIARDRLTQARGSVGHHPSPPERGTARRFLTDQGCALGPRLEALSPMQFSFLLQGLGLLFQVALVYFVLLGSTSAQIRTDGSTGLARTLSGPNFAIGAD